MFKKAPIVFVLLLFGGVSLGASAGYFYYRDQIGRYRIALGIDKVKEGALIELTDLEMKAKAANLAARLRESCRQHNNEEKNLNEGLNDPKIKPEDKGKARIELWRRQGDEFDKKLKAESANVDDELRRRIDPKAVQTIAGIVPSFQSSSTNASTSILSLPTFGEGLYSHGNDCILAENIERMGLLLSDK